MGTVVPSRAQSSHYPPPGPPLGNSREPGRKDALADGTPGLSLKARALDPSSADRVLSSTAPPTARHAGTEAGKSHCRTRSSPRMPGLEEGPGLTYKDQLASDHLWGFSACDRQPFFPLGSVVPEP